VLPIRSNGERPALHVRGANELLVAGDIDPALVLSAPFLHLGGPDEMTRLDPARIGALVGAARRAGVVVTADLLRGPAIEYRDAAAVALRDVSYFLPNHDQLFSLTRCSRMADAVEDVRRLGIGATLIVTLGAAGCLIVPPSGDWVRVAAYPVDVVDTTGCGDAFCAGLIPGLREGRTVTEAAVLGNRAAGLVATGLGSDAGIVDRSSLDDTRWAGLAAPPITTVPITADEVDALLEPVRA
jgi:sugar/nucleoside kinase (ribokinase family)